MTRHFSPTRSVTWRLRWLSLAVIVVVVVGARSSISAQPVATPSGEAVASPTPVPRPGQEITATGNPLEDIQIGVSLDDLEGKKYRNLHRVDDPQRILRLNQRVEIADDAQRLTNHGLPTIVVLRESTESREKSQAHADRLRVERGVESSSDADDGLVILATLNPYFPRSGSIVFSFGPNALPKGGLSAESAEAVYQQVMLPRLKRDRIYNALYVGIRQIIYLETYIPDPQPPPSNTERTLRGVVNVLGPLVLIGGAAAFVLMARRLSQASTGRRHGAFVRTAVIVGIGAILLFGVAVLARSAIGVASALLAALLIWTQSLIERLPSDRSQEGLRALTLPYRRSFRPVRRSRIQSSQRPLPTQFARVPRGRVR